VKNKVDLAHIKRNTDIMLDEFEAGFIPKVRKIRTAACEEIINRNYSPAFSKQGVTKMRTQEASSTRYQSALLIHISFVFLQNGGTKSPPRNEITSIL